MSDRNLDHLFPPFAEKVKTIITELNRWCDVHKPGYHAMMVEGFRSSEYQASLYAQGRTKPGSIVTQKNGTSNPSNHQSGLAADIVPSDGHTVDWNAHAFFGYLQHLAHVHGLTSGADWVNFKDMDHVEWPTKDKAAYLEAKEWLKGRGLV